jgi:glycosyltransferase involved in cell wall biosynthesis
VRIALVAPLVTTIREPQQGGTQSYLSDLATGLTARGHEVDVHAASGSEIPGARVVDTGIHPASLGQSLYRADGSRGGGRRASQDAFVAVYAGVMDGGYDVVHNHAFDAPAIALAAGLGVPVVHTLHLPPEPEIVDALRALEGAGTRVVVGAVSAAMARAWGRVTRIDLVLRDAVPTARIPWSRWGGGHALFAGRLSAEKGAAEAVDIARTAGMRIRLYGDAYDADYALHRVRSRGHEPGVDIRPAIERRRLWKEMARAAVVLCPARWDEPFGLVAAEAQAAGTPVVAFRRGALSEIVLDGTTGFLVDPDDIPAAAAAARQAGTLSRRACRAHAEAHLDIGAALDAHEALYRQVVGSTRVAAQTGCTGV